jgi:glycosyltransferase involved in cell wall biosynthesis
MWLMRILPVTVQSEDQGGNGAPLRVLLIARKLRFDAGVPRCLLYLARAADRRRIHLDVASFVDPSTQMAQEFGDLGVQLHWVGDRGYIRPAARLRALVDRLGTQIAVATSFKTYLCAKLALWHRNMKVVFWLHAVHGPVEGRFRRWLVSRLCRHDPMLFVSRAVKRAQSPPRHRGLSQVVYNGVEDVSQDPRYRPYPREMLATFGVPRDALTLAYIANFTDSKDHITTIAAMHELAGRGARAHLLLIGLGPGLERARWLAQQGPASGKIHFLGARSDARRLLGLADLYIHPGRGEGFGLAVVEAMLAGLPVIAARDGAFVEYISHGRTGMLFCPGDVQDLADTVQMLGSNKARAEAMGQAARLYCQKTFDLHGFADSVCDYLYESCGLPRRTADSVSASGQQLLDQPQIVATGG